MASYTRQPKIPGVTPHPTPRWRVFARHGAHYAGQKTRASSERAARRVNRRIEKAGGDAMFGLIELGVELLMHPLVLVLMSFMAIGVISLTLIDRALESTGGPFAFRLLQALGITVPGGNLFSGFNGSQQSIKLDDLGPLGQVGDQVGAYTINSGWGARSAPSVNGKKVGSSYHRGLDVPLALGTPLFAPVTGTRVTCREMGGLGTTGILDLGVVTVTASHLATCNEGTYQAGQSWGTSGNSGSSTGPHLHHGQYGAGDNWVHPNLYPLIGVVTGTMPGNSGGSVDINKLMQAFKAQESGGDHQIVNDAPGAQSPTGLFQIQSTHITSANGWDEQCLGQSISYTAFRASPDLQRQIARCKMEEYVRTAAGATDNPDEQIRRVAAMWYSGDMSNLDSNKKEPHGPTVREYTQQVLDRYKAL